MTKPPEPTPDDDRPAWMQELDDDVARLEAKRVREDPEDASQDKIDAAWRTEIERRSAELRSDPSIGLTWDEVKARIEEDRAKGLPGRTGRPIRHRMDADDKDLS